MKKKAAIARGVASVMAVTMFTSVSASVLMFDNAGVINQALNLSTSKIVELGDGEATNTVYYDNPCGTDTSDRQATMNMELAVAAENISQAEEGAVLLKNENAALPIAAGQRITIFGNGSLPSRCYVTFCRGAQGWNCEVVQGVGKMEKKGTPNSPTVQAL